METIIANEILKAQNLILKRISKDYNIPLSSLTGAKPKKAPGLSHNHEPGVVQAAGCAACAQYGNPFDSRELEFSIV